MIARSTVRALRIAALAVLCLAGAASAAEAGVTPGVHRVDLPHGVFAMEATPERILVATLRPRATRASYVRLEARAWDATTVAPIPLRLACGEISITEEGYPAFSLDDAGGLVALSAISREEHYVHGGVALAGSRQGNVVCRQFDRNPFGAVQRTSSRLLEASPPRRECPDGTRGTTCPLITPLIDLDTRARITVAQGAFTLIAAAGNLAVGSISYRDRQVPRLVGLDLTTGSERWARPLRDGITDDAYSLFGATDGTVVALGAGSGVLLLDAHTGRTTQTWRNVHFSIAQIAVADGLVAWFANPLSDAEGGLVYVRDAAGQHPPRVLATLPNRMTAVDIRLTSRGLAWAATHVIANNNPTHGGALWTASLPTIRRVLSRG
jgi:hypothetical protein